LVDLALIGPFFVRLLTGVLHPVPVRAKSETPSSRACRGVWTPFAMLDFGESRCDLLVDDFAKCAVKFPPYVDLAGLMLSSAETFFSGGVNGDDWLTERFCVRVRGDGVKGIRPPAVRVEKSPAWDLIGVHTEVAILQYQKGISGKIPYYRTSSNRLNLLIADRCLFD
jgi:hypothetical protein